jgi:hypothetical protein
MHLGEGAAERLDCEASVRGAVGDTGGAARSDLECHAGHKSSAERDDDLDKRQNWN